mmetsp:Transcript_50192/g.64335  ORF Transcript_50192/g.64335 Transcript_50192/m.64335 type:complete len:113 (+) Transcript_50192:79-417(+)
MNHHIRSCYYYSRLNCWMSMNEKEIQFDNKISNKIHHSPSESSSIIQDINEKNSSIISSISIPSSKKRKLEEDEDEDDILPCHRESEYCFLMPKNMLRFQIQGRILKHPLIG